MTMAIDAPWGRRNPDPPGWAMDSGNARLGLLQKMDFQPEMIIVI